ncbi:ABC transporter permease subunit [Demequina sp. B12]|uniref:ABC transporter permease subunit n=1 Tax=Demequina sp. B12 TaxID=2992757 RepID=UPI00237B2CCF|nr:ABC transporter permease subunit [Demequina sp. B12]MDE0573905.1 ABC transporter permease subunit [Demequina sp. B12]
MANNDAVTVKEPQAPQESHARRWRGLGWGFIAKLLMMALVNALGLAIIFSAVNAEAWAILAASAALLIAANIIYFSKRTLPLKYLFPGLIFLAIFQLFTLAYTGYVAFTNYGTGHAGSQQQAVEATLIQNERRADDSPTYPLAIVRDGDTLGFAVTDDDGFVLVGTEEAELSAVDGAVIDDRQVPTEVPGWTVVTRAELFADANLQNEVIDLRVAVSDDAEDGSLRTRDGSTAAIYQSSMDWDDEAQTFTDKETGTVYYADQEVGNFVAEDGSRLPTGWYVTVGFDNFVRAVTDQNLAGPLLKVTAWTFAFAILTVLTSFGLGLLFALIYNDPRIRGRKWMRTVFILPYAFPAFMSALLWRGMLNREFGIINDWFFFGADINWLGDPWLAKFAILWVNLWLSYPYWFLVCTGALQALPSETMEASKIDGAGRWRQFRSITLPLLLVSTAPLAISSFAFNFNNFTIIYMLTEGGPPFAGTSGLGSTDILISAIYNISGVSGGSADYGLASALSIIVFIFVGIISAIAFRQTRKLEEI